MGNGRVFISVALLTLFLCMIGCGVQHAAVSKAQQPSAPPAQAGGGFALPAPAALLSGMDQPRTAAEALLLRSGSDFVPETAQLVAAEGNSVRFSPGWTGGASGFETVACAIYQFNLEGVTESNTVELSWDTPPGEYANLWIGLSCWDDGCWEWFAGPADGTVELGALGSAPYSEPGTADMFVAVMLVGTAEAVLQQIEVNGNLPPIAKLTADSLLGLPPLTVNFDASGSSAPSGSIAKYEWDWDGAGNGPWDEDTGTTPTLSHAYATDATNTAWVRVTDDLGATDTASLKIIVSAAAGRGDWWMFGHDPRHTGRSPFTGPATSALKWSYTMGDPVDSAVYSSPAIAADGTVYVGCVDGKLYAFHPDGSLKWTYTTWGGGGIYSSSPAIGADGTVYVGSQGEFYAINPDGSLKWTYPAGDGNSSPAIGADGTVYVGDGVHGNVHAINPNGCGKWISPTSRGGWVQSCPAIGADGTVYVGSGSQVDGLSFGDLDAFNPDGSLKWNWPHGQGDGPGDFILTSPAIGADGTVYVGANRELHAITPDGSLKWAFAVGDLVCSSPTIGAGGTVYVGSADGKLYAINPDSSLKWTYTTWSAVSSSAATDVDGMVYVGSADGNLYAISPNGSGKWSYTTGGYVNSSPAIGADGTVYVGSDDGKLYAIGPGGG